MFWSKSGDGGRLGGRAKFSPPGGGTSAQLSPPPGEKTDDIKNPDRPM